jgi:hypothetical protein
LRGEAIFGEHEKAGIGAETMDILTEFGVESRLETEDYLHGLKNTQKTW